MKKLTLFAVVLASTLVVLSQDSLAQTNSLYESFVRKGAVKVYVHPIQNSSGNELLNPRDITSQIIDVLSKKQIPNFIITSIPSDADIVVEGDIEEAYFSLTDPIDDFVSWRGLLTDAAANENYAAANVSMRILDRNSKSLWLKKIKVTASGSFLTEEGVTSVLSSHLAKKFVSLSFARPRGSKR